MTAAAVYATPAQMLQAYDARTIGDLCSDSGTRVSASSLLSDPNLASAIEYASGKIDAALQAGGMYTPAQLVTLQASTADNTPFLLIGACCDLTMAILYGRRPAYDPQRLKWFIDATEGKDSILQKLRRGENVFGIASTIEAGLPSINGPTTLDYQNLNLIRDVTQNYYPQRYTPFNR